MLLDGKVALVTGAAQGIGRACAERLAQEGAKVVIADIDEEAGRAASAAIGKAGRVSIFHRCDVSERSDVHNSIGAAVAAFGRLDVLINNAGVVDDRPFLDLEEDEFDRVVKINLKGAFLTAQAAARQMVEQTKAAAPAAGFSPGSPGSPGSIVNMSSINAWFGLPDHVAYAVSKGGIMQLTKSMAVALAPYGIRVNAVGPGTIDTPLIENVVKDEAFRQKVLSRTPLGRFGRPEEVAAIAVWLASEEASYLTGTTVYADGGRMSLNYVVPVR
ncbi:MAG: SDR family NAD(P)-dependent oxidoreductase [Hyphomicrobiaceae bacterium]